MKYKMNYKKKNRTFDEHVINLPLSGITSSTGFLFCNLKRSTIIQITNIPARKPATSRISPITI